MKKNYKPAEDYIAEFQKIDRALLKEVLSVLFVGVFVGAIAALIHLWG